MLTIVDGRQPSDGKGGVKKPSKSEVKALIGLYDKWAAIPKPYAAEAWVRLGEEQQAKVRSAETKAYGSVTPQVVFSRDSELKRRADGFLTRYFDEKISDKDMLDTPLADLRALASAYAESGLATSDAEAKQMADAYKEGIVRQALKTMREQGRGR